MAEIIITGITGFRNKGVDALVTTTVEGIRSVSMNTTITVLTDTPEYDSLNGGKLQVDFQKDAFRHKHARYIRKLGKGSMNFAIPMVTPNYSKVVGLVDNSNMVIASGGDVFSSDYGDLGEFLISLETAKKAGKKVVFLGQSIGPFKTKAESDAWMRVAIQSDLITIRESMSYKYVIEKLGLPKSKVILTADSAFNLQVPNDEILARLALKYNIDRVHPTIVLSISQGINKFAKVNPDLHFDAWKEIIRVAIEKFKLQVILVPHVQDSWALNDDRIVAERIANTYNHPNIKLITDEHSASELKGIIQMGDLVVAERMHAAIAGLSSSKATAVIGYSVKARGILHDLIGQQLEDFKLLISVQELVGSLNIEQWITKQWNQKNVVSDHIRHNLPKIKEKAKQNFQNIAVLI